MADRDRNREAGNEESFGGVHSESPRLLEYSILAAIGPIAAQLTPRRDRSRSREIRR
jgi:hypothetical protein